VTVFRISTLVFSQNAAPKKKRGSGYRAMPKFGRDRVESGHHADTLNVQRLTQLRHWRRGFGATQHGQPIPAVRRLGRCQATCRRRARQPYVGIRLPSCGVPERQLAFAGSEFGASTIRASSISSLWVGIAHPASDSVERAPGRGSVRKRT
jgi:hypothetical protein